MPDQKLVKRRAGRYLLALAVGVFAAVSLLWVMQFLIATGKAAITEVYEGSVLDFVQVDRNETVERKRDKPEKPPEPDEAPPDLPQPDADTSDFDTMLGVRHVSPEINTGLDSDLGDFSVAEGDYLPLVRVDPIYPRRAQSRGLEGYCILQLTVTPLGGTTDIRVIECSSSLFERASIKAVEKFKYKPRVVDGKPIASPGVRYKMTFQIED